MPSALPELLIVLLLIVLNGVFAMSEMAIVSSRKVRLEQRAATGDRRARIALDLANNPNELLSTIQIGITLIGIVNGAYGGATISQTVSAGIAQVPGLAPYSGPLGFGLVVSVITYVSLIVGELVPKRLALGNAEQVAVVVAEPMRLLATLARPIVRLLSASNDLVLRLLGSGPSSEAPVTEEEIKILIQQATQAGIFHEAEQELVERVFKVGDARVETLMTPRLDVVWLDTQDPFAETRRTVIESDHDRFPVGRGSLDELVGVVQAKAVLALDGATTASEAPGSTGESGSSMRLESLTEPAVFVPETMDALRALEALRQAGTRLAIVVDEYGSTQGIITAGDILAAIVGDFPSARESISPEIVRLGDDAWSVDGMVSIDELQETLGLSGLEPDEPGGYRSLGGFVMTRLGQVPTVGDRLEWAGLRFEVADMDGRRVDRVLVQPVAPAAEPDEAGCPRS
jgi:putative hemolysin